MDRSCRVPVLAALCGLLLAVRQVAGEGVVATERIAVGEAIEADTVGRVGTKSAEGGFSFLPRAPPPEGLKVAVQNASISTFFQELLTGRTIPIGVPIVRGAVGAIRSGTLSGLTVRRATFSGPVRSYAAPDKGTWEVKVPEFAAAMNAEYDVQFTSLRLRETGSMNLTMGGGGLRLSVPASGEGSGSCHFDAATRLRIESTTPLDESGGKSPRDAVQSFVASVNDNLLSLQDQMLHTIERCLCTSMLASFGESGSAEVVGLGDQPAMPEWKALLADFGLTPLELAVAFGLCVFGWCLGACCCCAGRWCCGQRRRESYPEELPLQNHWKPGYDYQECGGGQRGILAPFNCCRRQRDAMIKPGSY
uniref:Lipid-binding serum glycoprotein N-terminal domain-containing protein n=1 Tax=Zooxanthella nutricula TaxID=1333877 RepID=A0A7S2HMK3_9DINO